MKKTKIVCTIGPASTDKDMIEKLISAGMNAVRINTSHADFDQYRQIISTVRELSDLPIILDTKGPEVRILTRRPMQLRKGDVLTAGFSERHDIYFDFNFSDKVKEGTKLLVGDGRIQFRIVNAGKETIRMKALNAESVSSGKRVNIPSVDLGLPVLREKDIRSMRFAKENNIEYIALSFTSSAEDVRQARRLLGKSRIIAKIENSRGVKNIDEILDAADGVMVARGDLGIEVKSEKLPILQKEIIRRCNQKGKIVITATQMLRSMVDNPTPTRAETSDVANAILDGTDAVMLSEETAIGKYPVKAVREMTNIAAEVEPAVRSHTGICPGGISEAITNTISHLARILPLTDIVTITRSGYTAQMISRYRLAQPIIAVTRDAMVKSQLMLSYGVQPVYYPGKADEDLTAYAQYLLEMGMVRKEDLVLFTSGHLSPEHSTNEIHIHRISELLRKI